MLDFTHGLQSADTIEQVRQEGSTQGFKKLVFRDEKGIGTMQRIVELKMNRISDVSSKKRQEFNTRKLS